MTAREPAPAGPARVTDDPAVRDWIAANLATAPPLCAEQLATLRAAFRPAGSAPSAAPAAGRQLTTAAATASTPAATRAQRAPKAGPAPAAASAAGVIAGTASQHAVTRHPGRPAEGTDHHAAVS